MAILVNGRTVVGDSGNADFFKISIQSDGLLEVPDDAPSIVANSNAYTTKTATGIYSANTMWSWWVRPLFLRHKDTSNNFSYLGTITKEGASQVTITNHNTGNTTVYPITDPAPGFYATVDDHNASCVCAGNGKVAVVLSGRLVNTSLGLSTTNLYWTMWNEGSAPVKNSLQNLEFKSFAGATSAGYTQIFNANGKCFILASSHNRTSGNQWSIITADWPLANFSSLKGLFRSTKTWPYITTRRSALDKDVINFALGWHPYNTDSDQTIRYGKILRNGNTAPWDVYSNNSVVGNITTESNLPLDENDLEIAVRLTDLGSDTVNKTFRLFEVHDDAIAFAYFDGRINRASYFMAYKTLEEGEEVATWKVKFICEGGVPFEGMSNGLTVPNNGRDYYGGMSINERNKFIVTVCVENNNLWEAREYQSFNDGNNWNLNSVVKANPYDLVGRPMEESLSEDCFVYNNTDQLGSCAWFGYMNGSDYQQYNTNAATVRLTGSGRANNTVDSTQNTFFSTINCNGFIEVV